MIPVCKKDGLRFVYFFYTGRYRLRQMVSSNHCWTRFAAQSLRGWRRQCPKSKFKIEVVPDWKTGFRAWSQGRGQR